MISKLYYTSEVATGRLTWEENITFSVVAVYAIRMSPVNVAERGAALPLAAAKGRHKIAPMKLGSSLLLSLVAFGTALGQATETSSIEILSGANFDWLAILLEPLLI